MTVISVRGTARLPVAPDSAHLALTVSSRGNDNAIAMAELETAVTQVVDALVSAGAVPVALGERPPLAFQRGQVSVHRPSRWDPKQDQEVPYGPVLGSAQIDTVVRDWALLDAVMAAVRSGGTGSATVALQGTAWEVDDDNAGWAAVRAAAVADAKVRAGDYAAALGVELGPLEHLADTGLLGSAEAGRRAMAFATAASHVRESGTSDSGGPDGSGLPQLDPQHSRLTAQVEARFSSR